MSTYIAKPVDKNGIASYTSEENAIWAHLLKRQLPIVTTRACKEYLDGLKLLQLPPDRIPQCPEISSILKKLTGWTVAPVPALIPAEQFFSLLANKQFPAATFIRRQDEIDYLQEPDIFHEFFGHCPLLTNQAYADFTQHYGRLALKASDEDREMLARLYWFTIEFGLTQTPTGIRAYGGGILSSMSETIYCVESPLPERKSFDILEALRTPYRIDILQPIYFVLSNLNALFELNNVDLMEYIQKAKKLGLYQPVYSKK